jgi:hypothetical protein
MLLHENRSLRVSRFASLTIALALMFSSPQLKAQEARPSGALQAFMLTTTYGVIAGSLTGLASLAFYENPGNHTRNIAMGASIGLYTGLLLGAYVVYMPAIRESGSRDDDTFNDDQDPINLNFRSERNDGPLHSARMQAQATPWIHWSPHRGTQVGLVYNF